MKALKIIVVVTAILSAAVCQAAGLTRTVTVKESILGRSLSMKSTLSQNLDIKGEEGDLRGNIYEFHSKSPMKAFALSLVVPGAGQYYNGSRIKAATFLGADIALWSGYFFYHHKGVTTENNYKSFADEHYLTSVFFEWWNGLDTAVTNRFSHRIEPGVKNREYYENIGKYDQFQVGWDDIGTNVPPPGTPGGDSTTAGAMGTEGHRLTYLNMRKKSNDYFDNAKTFFVVSIGNHIISAFEAAIGARRFNRGGKQYSIQLHPYNLNGRIIPMAVAEAKF